ncbi:MAG: ABC transporter ATP-binding protein, partial [Acholeplasmataceae bacterium]|nr:ABC transporter ATP-binding protein [Acholeplasmataceae bacterium]
MFKELGWFIKKEWYKYILIIIFTVIYTYVLTIPPKYIGLVIDLIASNGLSMDYAVRIIAIILGTAMIIYLSEVGKNFLTNKLFHNLYYEIRNRFLRSIFRQDGEFFEEYYSGDLISRATSDSNTVARVSTHVFFHLLDTIAMLIIAFSSLIALNPQLTFYSILPLPIIFLIVIILRPKIMKNWKKVRSEVSHLNNLVMESVTHAKLIRGFVKEKEDKAKLSKMSEQVYKTERLAVLMQSVFQPSFKMVTVISQGIALAYGSYLIMNQLDFTVGSLVSFNLYLGMFASPLFRLGNQITVLSQSTVSYERISEIINHPPSIIDKEDAVDLEKVDSIEYQNLSFKYPKDNDYIIKNINISLKQGETLGVVGKTGSGKTTLVRQLLRQYLISEGNVYINDQPLENYTKESLRQNVAYVPQEHQLFSRTVMENLLLGLSPNTEISVSEAIEMADFEKDLPFLTDGLETIVGESGVTLSGGQKQRLSIARAFLKNAPVLIMDDSLSAVDGITEMNILKHLRNYRQGKINIITSHRLTVVEEADKIIVLDKGKIVE